MEMRGQKPPKKGEHLRWEILHPGWGKKYRGWKVGPNWGFESHHVGVSKPCLDKITQGAMKCRWCGPDYSLGFTGYLPLILENGQKSIVLYGKDFEDIVSEIPFNAEIQILKGNCKTAPVIISQKEWCGHGCPWIGRLKVQHDIRPKLLELWKIQELKDYFGMEPAVIPIPRCDSGEKSEGDKPHPMLGKLAERFRQVEPSKNGTGKPHPKN